MSKKTVKSFISQINENLNQEEENQLELNEKSEIKLRKDNKKGIEKVTISFRLDSDLLEYLDRARAEQRTSRNKYLMGLIVKDRKEKE